MSILKHQKAIEGYISNLSDKDFISFCDRLLFRLYPKSLLSCSILENGYNNIDGSLFLVVPNEFEDSSTIESIIPDDLENASVKSVVFFSRDSFRLSQEQKENLKSNFGKKRIDVWGLETIKLKLSSFGSEDQYYIIGNDSVFTQFLSTETDLTEEMDIIHNIFNFIKKNTKPIKTVPNIKEKPYAGIVKKIQYNFTTFRARVYDMYQLTYYHKSLVEKYFRDPSVHDKSETVILREFFRSKYLTITGYLKSTYPVNEYKFLEMLADACLEAKFKQNIKYNLWAKAIVMYFFEYCDFGARNKQDTIIQEDLFENLNSDLN